MLQSKLKLSKLNGFIQMRSISDVLFPKDSKDRKDPPSMDDVLPLGQSSGQPALPEEGSSLVKSFENLQDADLPRKLTFKFYRRYAQPQGKDSHGSDFDDIPNPRIPPFAGTGYSYKEYLYSARRHVMTDEASTEETLKRLNIQMKNTRLQELLKKKERYIQPSIRKGKEGYERAEKGLKNAVNKLVDAALKHHQKATSTPIDVQNPPVVADVQATQEAQLPLETQEAQ